MKCFTIRSGSMHELRYVRTYVRTYVEDTYEKTGVQ